MGEDSTIENSFVNLQLQEAQDDITINDISESNIISQQPQEAVSRISESDDLRYVFSFKSDHDNISDPFYSFGALGLAIPRPAYIMYLKVCLSEAFLASLNKSGNYNIYENPSYLKEGNVETYGEFLSKRLIYDNSKQVWYIKPKASKTGNITIVPESKLSAFFDSARIHVILPGAKAEMALNTDRLLKTTLAQPNPHNPNDRSGFLDYRSANFLSREFSRSVGLEEFHGDQKKLLENQLMEEFQTFHEYLADNGFVTVNGESTEDAKKKSPFKTETVNLIHIYKSSGFFNKFAEVVPFASGITLHEHAKLPVRYGWPYIVDPITKTEKAILFSGFGDSMDPTYILSLLKDEEVLLDMRYMFQMLLEVVCDNNRYLYWYFTTYIMLQFLYPDQKLGKVFHLVGEQGIGKSLLANFFFRLILGPQISVIANSWNKVGVNKQFANLLIRAKTCLVEEGRIDFSEGSREESEYKDFVTNPMQTVEPKFGGQVTVEQPVNFMTTENEIPDCVKDKLNRRDILFLCRKSKNFNVPRVVQIIKNTKVIDLTRYIFSGDRKAYDLMANQLKNLAPSFDNTNMLLDLNFFKFVPLNTEDKGIEFFWTNFVKQQATMTYTHLIPKFFKNANPNTISSIHAFNIPPFTNGNALSWTQSTHHTIVGCLLRNAALACQINTLCTKNTFRDFSFGSDANNERTIRNICKFAGFKRKREEALFPSTAQSQPALVLAKREDMKNRVYWFKYHQFDIQAGFYCYEFPWPATDEIYDELKIYEDFRPSLAFHDTVENFKYYNVAIQSLTEEHGRYLIKKGGGSSTTFNKTNKNRTEGLLDENHNIMSAYAAFVDHKPEFTPSTAAISVHKTSHVRINNILCDGIDKEVGSTISLNSRKTSAPPGEVVAPCIQLPCAFTYWNMICFYLAYFVSKESILVVADPPDLKKNTFL